MFWTHKFVSARTHKLNIENESLLSMSATETSFIIKGNTMTPGPEVIKKVHTEHEISTADKILTNEEVSCFKPLRCSIYYAKNVKMPKIVGILTFYEQDKVCAQLS